MNFLRTNQVQAENKNNIPKKNAEGIRHISYANSKGMIPTSREEQQLNTQVNGVGLSSIENKKWNDNTV